MTHYQSPPDLLADFRALQQQVMALVTATQQRTIPFARVQRNASVAVPDSGEITVSFDAVSFDTGRMWASGDPTKVYARNPGILLVSAIGKFNGLGGEGYRWLRMEQASVGDTGTHHAQAYITAGAVILTATDSFNCAQDEAITLHIGQDTVGGNESLTKAVMNVAYVGPGIH